jgi:YidC/Oxa1 family membrane protein insertase
MQLYQIVGNYGLAVILFALIIRIILTPFQMKSKRSTLKTSRLQPKMKELEKKHGANRQKYQEEVAKLYREEKINPASGCLWTLIPLPIIIALFSAVRQPLTIMMGVAQELLNEGGLIYNKLVELGGPVANATYLQIEQAKFISDPANFSHFASLSDALRQINYNFFGMNLGDTPQWNFLWKTDWSNINVWGPGLLLFLLPIASGALAYLSSRIAMKLNPMSDPQQASTNRTMTLFMPLISVYFAFVMPGAIGLYIIASTLFTMIQDTILTKHYIKVIDAEEAEKLEKQRQREAELEAKREETERKRLESATEKNRNTSKKKLQKTERQEQLEKAAEWEKKNAGIQKQETDEPSRVGDRRYARGRAYDPFRYERPANSADTGDGAAQPQESASEASEPAEDAAQDTGASAD